MKRLFSVLLAAFALAAHGIESKDAMSDSGELVDVRRLVPGAWEVLPADWFPASPKLRGSLEGLSVSVVSSATPGATTNVSARAYRRTQLWYAITGGTLDNATNHFPFIKVRYLSADGMTEPVVAFQDPAVYLGAWTQGGTTYQQTWRSDCWVRSDAGSAYFTANVPVEGDETYKGGYPLSGNADSDYARGIAVLVSQGGDDVQYVTVDEMGNVTPSNVLATAAMAAEVEAKVLLAEASAAAQTNAYMQATEAVNEIARALTDRQVTIYQDDYVYSFGEVVSVSTNCKCRVYRFDAKVAESTVGGVQYERSDVYFGFTEDIGSLSPVAWLKSTLSTDLDWDEALVDEIQPQQYSFERDGESYSHCYLLRVYVPKAWNAAFIKVFTEVTSGTGDGSHIDFIGGAAGGYNGVVDFGGQTLQVKGGFIMAPGVD